MIIFFYDAQRFLPASGEVWIFFLFNCFVFFGVGRAVWWRHQQATGYSGQPGLTSLSVNVRSGRHGDRDEPVCLEVGVSARVGVGSFARPDRGFCRADEDGGVQRETGGSGAHFHRGDRKWLHRASSLFNAVGLTSQDETKQKKKDHKTPYARLQPSSACTFTVLCTSEWSPVHIVSYCSRPMIGQLLKDRQHDRAY